MSYVEKRRVQRVVPDHPIQSKLSGLSVLIVDLSTVGVRIEHEFPLTAARPVRLEFAHLAEKFSLRCEVVRCKLQKSGLSDTSTIVYNSGLRFIDPGEPSREGMRRLVAALVLRSLDRGSEAGDPRMSNVRF